MFPNYGTLCLASGIILGMLYYHKTGWGCGGIITPGLIAMYSADPWKLSLSMAAGGVTFLLLSLLIRWSGVYGRQRVAAAMLIALCLNVPLTTLFGGASLWLGWVVPGLIGADMRRQGVLITLSSATATGIATAMTARLIMALPVLSA